MLACQILSDCVPDPVRGEFYPIGLLVLLEGA